MTNPTPTNAVIDRLKASIEAGTALGPVALYFGCLGRIGHCLYDGNGRTIYDVQRDYAGFSWSEPLLDTGLLKNGNHPDIYDGKVFWTCGGATAFWYAFFWWDRSVDTRGNSNSGFYVRGFGWPEAQNAFDFACAEFPRVVRRQGYPLVLQGASRGIKQ